MTSNSHKILLPFLGCAFFLLTGYTGTIEVNEPLRFESGKEQSEIATGEYNIKVGRRGFKKLRLQIASGEEMTKVDFKFPKGKSIPKSGDFSLSYLESGSEYSIEGRIDSTSEDSGERTVFTTCSYFEPQTYCRYNPYGYRYCNHGYGQRFGTQEITYFERVTTETLSMDLINPDKDVVSATVDSSRVFNKIIRTYTGVCR